MSRIPALAPEAAPAAARPLLDGVAKGLGNVPNLFRVLANAPSALEGYLALSGALAKGRLDAGLRERIALAVSEFNRCDYCLAAHTYLGRNVAKLGDPEIQAARDGTSADARARAAVQFALAVAARRGHVPDEALTAVRVAGFDDAEVLEIVGAVALNVLTNYTNSVAATAVDFPAVSPARAAA
jgi:uncharacterized peroxidase-related enzyme